MVVHQQGREEAQDMFPVDFMGFQNLLQVTQQLLHAEDHSQLLEEQNSTEQLLNSPCWPLICKLWLFSAF